MEITKTIDIKNFQAWSGAIDTLNTIIENDKLDDFEMLCEDIFFNGCTETQLNDFLWFDDEFIFENLSIEIE